MKRNPSQNIFHVELLGIPTPTGSFRPLSAHLIVVLHLRWSVMGRIDLDRAAAGSMHWTKNANIAEFRACSFSQRWPRIKRSAQHRRPKAPRHSPYSEGYCFMEPFGGATAISLGDAHKRRQNMHRAYF